MLFAVLFVFMFLFLLLVVTPFVCGLISNRGPEWVCYPTMYLNLYLLFLANQGLNLREWFETHV